MPRRHVLMVLLLSIAPAGAPAAPPEQPSPEENILRQAGVPVDGDGLLAFFRGRTLTDAETKQIGELIHRLGGEDFDDREAAAKALKKVGGRATPLLRAAAHSKDAEVAHRAEQLLKDIEPLPSLPAVAAARLLARRARADAVPVLLAYLPFADDGAVEDEVFAALLALTPDGGKADPALGAALDDPQPMRRAAAAYVLGRKGDKDQRDAVRKRLEDADAQVRWQAAAALLAGRDRAAVPALMALLADGPFDPAWRAEEALRRLAGDQAPKAALDDSPEGRAKCRDAWAAWWKENGDGVDVAGYKEPERPLGYTLAVEFNTGRVWECDLDGSIRWEIRDLAGPMDAQVLPNGHVLIAEANARRITERDTKGAVLWEKKIDGEPNGCRRLPDGNTFVCTTRSVFEAAADGATLYSYMLPEASSAVQRLPNGHVIYATSKKIREVGKPDPVTFNGLVVGGDEGIGRFVRGIRLPWEETAYVDIQELPGDRFLVANLRSGRVLEVDAEGKTTWEAAVPGACGVCRLLNGHTLVSVNHKVIELDARGEPAWERKTEGYPRRVYGR